MSGVSLGNNLFKAIDLVDDVGTSQTATLSSANEEDLKASIRRLLGEMMGKKDGYIASIEENKLKFDKFISPGKNIKPGAFSFLSILRRWNSYTPVLPQRKAHTKGGGYFIHHNEIGIVIDPGYNFIENFLSEGFKLDDIDVVIITHAHNDHTVELESIMSLLYKRNKKKEEEELKQIDIYMNLGTFKKYAAFFDLSQDKYPNYIKDIILMNSYNKYNIPKNTFDSELSIFTNVTQHHEMITSKYALGFIIKCGDKYIKFTGDTGWNDDIERKNNEFYESENIPQIDILIPHIGSVEESEFNFDFAKSLEENRQNKIFYNNHLGLLGCICMIRRYQPGLVVVSEFGEELKHIRIDIVAALSNATNTECLTGDIGLHIHINDNKVLCSKSGKLTDCKDIEQLQLGDDLWYVAKDSFTLGQCNIESKLAALKDIERKTIVDIVDAD